MNSRISYGRGKIQGASQRRNTNLRRVIQRARDYKLSLDKGETFLLDTIKSGISLYGMFYKFAVDDVKRARLNFQQIKESEAAESSIIW